MIIVNWIKQLFKQQCSQPSSILKVDDIQSYHQREQHFYDSDQLQRTKLYEKWMVKDQWLLLDQGLKLIMGIDPDQPITSSELSEELDKLKHHAIACVEKKHITVLNLQEAAEKWLVKPIDLYHFASISRINIPVEFSNIAEFIVKTTEASKDTQQDTHQREKVLGIALHLLINKSIPYNADFVACVLQEINQNTWLGKEELHLSSSDITNLLDHYLKSSHS